MRNYGPWGEWDEDGRQFRYPVTSLDEDGDLYRTHLPDPGWPVKTMMTGHYAFGANQLHVFEALNAILRLLEEEYGLDL